MIAQCQLREFSSGAEDCEYGATHLVTTQLSAEPDAPQEQYELCEEHARGAHQGQHRHPARPGEIVSVTPSV